ncbi:MULTISPECIES: hypothetical protein [Priestia]|uniref:hypothetical protein n=1 Tax=Priestia TaxID=2800373 RepID=UPI000BEC9E39|nr:hypothetical protein [Priestia megaterium]MDW4511086.1 hypothetical protein [Priestia megaterium]PEC45331.1 hypothetical protein CON11_08810 [Priestia megaterium]CAH0257933.1 hypothetical protein SRABI82_03313 [Priestia megaterium]
MPNLHTVVSFFSSTCMTTMSMIYLFSLVPRAWSFKFRFGAMIIGIPVGIIMGQVAMLIGWHHH